MTRLSISSSAQAVPPPTPVTRVARRPRSRGGPEATRAAWLRSRGRPLVAVALVAWLAVGCAAASSDADHPPTPAPPVTAPADPAPPPSSTSSTPSPTAPATIVRAAGPLDVHEAPDGPVLTTLPATTAFGSPSTLLAVADPTPDILPGWTQVYLPVRPNGTTGWVRDADVELRPTTLVVEVDLDARELTVLDGAEVVLTTPTAIGDADHPTPTGTFFITDKLRTGDPDGPYGPYALGLSARSDVLTEFAGGDGQVGIHGTNVPDSIGRAASHGCLRVANDVVERLASLLPLGTPVTIS